jgi:SAM-dependent methyltransferase
MTPPSACPLCAGHQGGPLEQATINETSYTLYGCETCKVQFWIPFKNPGAAWYEHDARYADRNHDPILLPNEKHRGVVSFFGKETGRALDVGCGTGNFLAYAEHKGWEGWGIDFDADAIDAGKGALGLERLEVADIGTFASRHPDLRFDLITFFDVIEHLDDHETFMRHVNTLLADEGYLAFSMPYRHSWRWLIPHDLPPRHLTRWDEASTRAFLTQHGYQLIRFVRVPASLYFIVMKLRFRFGAWTSFGLVGKAKENAKREHQPVPGTSPQRTSINILAHLAKVKDMLLFGAPAFVIWLLLLPTRKRYTNSYAIAQKIQCS